MNSNFIGSAIIAVIVSSVIGVSALTLLPREQAAGTADNPKAPSIERVIHRYIVEHPEVITEAIEVLRARQQEVERETARQRIAANGDQLFHEAGSVVAGNPDGDVTIVEFFDYNCAYCKRAYPTLVKLREEDSGVRFIYKEFPILGPVSVYASRVSLAANRQGKFEEFHDALMKSRDKLSTDSIIETARQLGLDMARLEQDMRDPELDAIIQRNMSLARSLNISGTPSFVIGDTLIPGFVDRAYLDAVIAETREQ
ncbi:MAG: DsbA family protein [Sphingomonadales bacterium]